MTIIYILTNILTGLSYVGKTGKTLEDRWERHVADARRGVDTYLYRAMEKYGEGAFVRETICECPDDEGNLWERYCIIAFNTRSPRGYNMTDGGDGVPGYIFTEEDRKKLGSGLRGKKRPPRSEAWKQKLSESGKGKVAWNKGQPWPESTRQKLIEIGKSLYETPERKALIKANLALLALPENRAKGLQSRAERYDWSEEMLKRSANPEWIEKQKLGSKLRSQNPQWHENCRKGQKLRRDRERFERILLNAPIQYVQPL